MNLEKHEKKKEKKEELLKIEKVIYGTEELRACMESAVIHAADVLFSDIK